jgi:hypothetical protein
MGTTQPEFMSSVFDTYAAEHLEEYARVGSSFASARSSFITRFQQLLRKQLGSDAVVVAGNVNNALDRSHFEVNQFVGRVRLPPGGVSAASESVAAPGILDLCGRYGLFMVAPGDGWTYVWLPMYWDPLGRRHAPSMVIDNTLVGSLVGWTKDVWGQEVPLYTHETYEGLKRRAMTEALALLPPLEGIPALRRRCFALGCIMAG